MNLITGILVDRLNTLDARAGGGRKETVRGRGVLRTGYSLALGNFSYFWCSYSVCKSTLKLCGLCYLIRPSPYSGGALRNDAISTSVRPSVCLFPIER